MRPPEIGAAPGTWKTSGEDHSAVVQEIDYDRDHIDEHESASGEPYQPSEGAPLKVRWINVDSTQDGSALKELEARYGLHPLALEDVVHGRQRAKVDVYDDHLFMILHTLSILDGVVSVEQLSVFVGATYVITIQEHAGDCMDSVRRRIRQRQGLIRGMGADYLAYAILDAVIDQSFPILEELGERLEDLEESVLFDDDSTVPSTLRELRKDLSIVRKVIWPMRECAHALIRDRNALISEEVQLYLRDCTDHLLQLVDLTEILRELSAGIMDIHLARQGHRMNQVMKVLTMLSTVFLPLGFLAGLYGMNFDTAASAYNMPELSAPYGYVILLCAMSAIAAAMLTVFWKKGWLTEG